MHTRAPLMRGNLGRGRGDGYITALRPTPRMSAHLIIQGSMHCPACCAGMPCPVGYTARQEWRIEISARPALEPPAAQPPTSTAILGW